MPGPERLRWALLRSRLLLWATTKRAQGRQGRAWLRWPLAPGGARASRRAVYPRPLSRSPPLHVPLVDERANHGRGKKPRSPRPGSAEPEKLLAAPPWALVPFRLPGSYTRNGRPSPPARPGKSATHPNPPPVTSDRWLRPCRAAPFPFFFYSFFLFYFILSSRSVPVGDGFPSGR